MLGGVRGDWKEWVAMGVEIFINSLRCVACTVSIGSAAN